MPEVVKLKHVKRVKTKGRWYYYHQKTGERLPNRTVERAQRVLEINAGVGPSQAPIQGSYNELIARYKAAPEFQEKAPRTRKDYMGHLTTIAGLWGGFQVTDTRRAHVLALRDTGQRSPRQANYLIQVLSLLLSFAVDREYREDNPASKVKRLKEGDGYTSWPDYVIEDFRDAAYFRLWLAIALLRYTGQRPQDVIVMAWNHYDGQNILVRQQKTNERLLIPCAAELREILDAAPRDATLITITKTGRPWTVQRLAQETARVMTEIGLKGYTPHGLRHTAGESLAEIGCSEHEIKAITGLKTSAMVARYTKGASQKRLARGAVERFDRARKSNKIGKLSD